jgi:hypothetical protein
MSYEILGSTGKYWTCHQCDWGDYLDVAVAFGWEPAGAFFKCDEGGHGEHPSGSYFGNSFQIVTDGDARAMAAALNRAVATINAGAPMTDEQAAALKALEIDHHDPLLELKWTEMQRADLLRMRNEYLAAHPNEFRSIRTHLGTFDINVRGMMDLADAASAGSFTIA